MIVGVTCKNSKSTIKQCVDSLLNLNYPKNKYKIFVVDGFSTDGTYEILKKYGEKIRLEQVKSNIAGGHNFIIKNSNSEIIALTDADCVADRNWLMELIRPFENKEIGATTGLVKTPKNVNKLQKIIGRELETRYNKFSNFVSRGPTMSLAFRTKLAKKILFDENYDVAQETDWGYRFTKHYKMAYIPKAIVYHYHRATWKNFFKQQFKYAKMVPSVYLRRHKTKIVGDEISKFYMPVQIAFLYVAVLFLLIGYFVPETLFLFYVPIAILFLSYVIHALTLSKNFEDFVWFLCLFFVRNVAWNLGIIVGIFKVI